MKIIDMDELEDLEDVEQTQEESEDPEKEDKDNIKEDTPGELKEQPEEADIKEAVLPDSRPKEKKNPLREIFSLVISVAVVVALTFIIVEYVGQRTQVSGSSMEYTLSDKDNLIVDKITYRFADPKRFDIIVFPYKSVLDNESTYYIKRIIGLPGETVQIKDGIIYINGKELKESYGREVIQDPKKAANEIKLGDDEYFVLGDNRNHSADSREIGNIKRSDIMGRAWIRIWPLEKIGILKHQ